jgi:hypothetical protein
MTLFQTRRFAGLLALLAAMTALVMAVPRAEAIVIAEDGHWCGFDSSQKLTPAQQASLPERLLGADRTCQYAETHFAHYGRSVKAVRFIIEQRKFLKEMYVGRHKWIGSADIGHKPEFRASENGHDVHGTFHSDFFAAGKITLDGQSDYFYAYWISA